MERDLYTEEEIVRGCIENDRHFQEILYRMHARKMYGVCMGYAGGRPLAQDMLQEAFVKVFRNIRQYGGKGSLEGWIRRIVINTAIDHLRKENHNMYLFNEDITENQHRMADETMSVMETKDILAQIAKLPEGARIIFNLYAVEGFSHNEIAARLHISAGTSKSQFSRARKLLQGWLQQTNV